MTREEFEEIFFQIYAGQYACPRCLGADKIASNRLHFCTAKGETLLTISVFNDEFSSIRLRAKDFIIFWDRKGKDYENHIYHKNYRIFHSKNEESTLDLTVSLDDLNKIFMLI